jgi:hypothetical protein
MVTVVVENVACIQRRKRHQWKAARVCAGLETRVHSKRQVAGLGKGALLRGNW